MPEYEFSLPWPPSLNNYRYSHNNRLFTSKKGRDYHKAVKEKILELKLNKEDLDQPLLFSLILFPSSKRKFDCSNFLKAYEDALVNAGFLKDDHWIEYGGIRKGPVIKGGKMDIKVSFLN